MVEVARLRPDGARLPPMTYSRRPANSTLISRIPPKNLNPQALGSLRRSDDPRACHPLPPHRRRKAKGKALARVPFNTERFSRRKVAPHERFFQLYFKAGTFKRLRPPDKAVNPSGRWQSFEHATEQVKTRWKTALKIHEMGSVSGVQSSAP